MPGQFYSDKYIKNRRGAEKAQDNLRRTKAKAEETLSEEREERRRFNREVAKEAQETAKEESNQALNVT